MREPERYHTATWRGPPTLRQIEALIRARCMREGITPEGQQAGSRRGQIPALCAELARRLVTGFGLSLADVA